MSNRHLIRDFVDLARCCNHIAIHMQRHHHLFAAGDWRTQRDNYMSEARQLRRDACR